MAAEGRGGRPGYRNAACAGAGAARAPDRRKRRYRREATSGSPASRRAARSAPGAEGAEVGGTELSNNLLPQLPRQCKCNYRCHHSLSVTGQPRTPPPLALVVPCCPALLTPPLPSSVRSSPHCPAPPRYASPIPSSLSSPLPSRCQSVQSLFPHPPRPHHSPRPSLIAPPRCQ